MRYNALTRRYFESGSGAGVLAGPAVGRGTAGSREGGTWVQFDIALESEVALEFALATPAHGRAPRIAAARFLAFACPHTIAAAAWLVERSVGAPCHAALPESVHEIAARFEMPVEKLGRLLIVEDAWRAAAKAAVGLSA